MLVSDFSVSEEQIEKILYLKLWIINFVTANWQVENGRNLTENSNLTPPSPKRDFFIFDWLSAHWQDI